ncbi:MAG: excinuclease ABC subunit UvrC [Cyclobacteriaceae bacterium]
MSGKNEHIKQTLASLPHSPGIYQFYDKQGTIIYIGKAKDLKKRVSSYFNRMHEVHKINILVRNIVDIQIIVVENESDALLLENNLVKKYQPRYNVQLKDDKTFPWICIKNEPFPRVFLTRNVVEDGSLYFGPFTSAKMVRTLLNLIKRLYKLRTCSYNLSPENIAKNKFKVCLEYHIGNCKGPCENLQSIEEYDQSIEQIKKIVKGNISEVIIYLKAHMKELASHYKFEEAQLIKDKISVLEKYKSKSTIVNPAIHDLEVYSIAHEGKSAFVNFLKISNGAIIQAHTLELEPRLDETPEEILSLAIENIRLRLNSSSREVLVPFMPSDKLDNINYSIPKIGDKRKLLELSERNAKYTLLEHRKQKQAYAEKPNKTDVALKQMQDDLRLTHLPKHIECFDNSNLQGSNPVAACVVFKNARPAKKEYRHYNVKTVTGPDDYASMREIVSRRYSRLKNEGSELPQLIVIDGGKGQLRAAYESLKDLNLSDKITVLGIAKRLEEIFFPGDAVPLYLDKNSITLRIIQQLRNEAHRFGITFHRNKRSKAGLKSDLEKLPGIGEKTLQKLFIEYKTMDKIRSQNPEELANIIGQDKAKTIYNYLKHSYK